MDKPNLFQRIFTFYYEGFRSMTWGRTLWAIILVKLVVMFVVLRIFFFPNFLGERCQTEDEKSTFVGGALIERAE